MEKTELGNTCEKVSIIGLGTMYFGSKTDGKESFALLDFYTGHGGSFLDTANKYASWLPGCRGGESETLLGKWMKSRHSRQQVFIASKVGFPYGEIPRSLKKEIIVSECEKSLKRLGAETIDLYFAHAFDKETPPEETMEAFHILKKQGKIRFAGASNFYAWQLQEANTIAGTQGWEGFCCIQQRHTYLEPSLRAGFGTQLLYSPDLQEFCIQQNITPMAYSPLLGGTYAKPGQEIPLQYQSSVNVERMKTLSDVANQLHVSFNAVVLAWMMQSKPPVIPLMTGSSVTQAEENLQALNFRLSDEQMGLLNRQISKQNKY